MIDVPHTPTEAPSRDSAGSSLTSINVLMPSSIGEQMGGIPILSYALEQSSDQSTWVELVGLTSDSTATFYTWTGLTTGDHFYFRYSVRNELGWSGVSPTLETWVGTEPAQMVAPTVSIDTDPTQILIQWTALDSSIDGGLPLTGYAV